MIEGSADPVELDPKPAALRRPAPVIAPCTSGDGGTAGTPNAVTLRDPDPPVTSGAGGMADAASASILRDPEPRPSSGGGATTETVGKLVERAVAPLTSEGAGKTEVEVPRDGFLKRPSRLFRTAGGGATRP